MSLLTRLWIGVLSAMLLALAGSFVVSVLTARDYIAQQLYAQAADNAASLALSMSQQSKDAAMSELLVSALFDSGHFESIVFRDVNGRVVVERHNRVELADAPDVFVRWVPIVAQPGLANVSDGWKQAGSVEVRASARYAYGALWRGSQRLAVTLAVVGLLLGVVVTFLMRWLKGPLMVIVHQAEEIGQRRFLTAPEPPVKELRIVSRAMNAMVERVKAMFAEQSARIDQLRTEASRDALTSLPNREFFVAGLRQMVEDEDRSPSGVLCAMRVQDLDGINRRLGRERGDALLQACGDIFKRAATRVEEPVFGRLGGAEFALLLTGADAEQAASVCKALLAEVESLFQREMVDRLPAAALGWTLYARGDGVSAIMARLDTALMMAESAQPPIAGVDRSDGPGVLSGAAWRTAVDTALAHRHFELSAYPVMLIDGQLLHDEVMLRLIGDDGVRMSAGLFMPAVLRQGRQVEIDLLALDLAIERLASVTHDIALNLSPASLHDAGFVSAFATRLNAAPEQAKRLWLEVSERTLMDELGLQALKALSELTRQCGCKLGVEHFGRYFAALPSLHEIQVDYVKLDGAFVAGIDSHAGNQRFVRSVVSVASSMDMRVIAERVGSEAEWQALRDLGVYGVTGPAVTQRLSAAS
ncbi:EAL domain-containing protein [Uliginosibacterium sediminicola]|uniref:EAL domain-containing protein n=1 Tax=Uliginosibacterium sediminicola TaxID=2024550 RepID=A0ABU9Z369_9RHOO